jgi:hypothetical protein
MMTKNEGHNTLPIPSAVHAPSSSTVDSTAERRPFLLPARHLKLILFLFSTLRQPIARHKRHGTISILTPISRVQIKRMIVAVGDIEAQPYFRKLLLDQLHKSLRLAKVYDRIVIAMYDPTSRR